MKTSIRLFALFALGSLASSQQAAEFESLKIEPGLVPQYSPALQSRGITRGQVKFVANISAEGKLTDWLVLGYTHEAMVNPCLEVLKEASITPARQDGVPVAVQVELSISYTAEGVVISRSTMEDLDITMDRQFGLRLRSVAQPASSLDRTPAVVKTVAPLYATEAEKQGVRGKVEVRFYIDETGAVRLPAVAPEAQPYLADTAVNALREWRFEPPMRHGQPVLVAASQVFEFGKVK